jgi:lipoate-protein ligase A
MGAYVAAKQCLSVSRPRLKARHRTVISEEQNRINDPELGDKKLSGAAVLERARTIYQATTGVDPDSVDPASRDLVDFSATRWTRSSK